MLRHDGKSHSPSLIGKITMTADEFRAWRRRLGMTQQEAADELKLRSVRPIQHYEEGTESVSPRIVMLCAAVARRWHRSKGGYDFHDPRDIVAPPQAFFDRLDAEFKFTLDVCALPENAKCRRYFTPEIDGLARPWRGRCWMNPPFFEGRVAKWLEKAVAEVEVGRAKIVVALVHARPDSPWWHDYVMKAEEIRFVRGRLPGYGRLAVIVFRPGVTPPRVSTIYASVATAPHKAR
jgi:phage N-6-adenine-methyltransferase